MFVWPFSKSRKQTGAFADLMPPSIFAGSSSKKCEATYDHNSHGTFSKQTTHDACGEHPKIKRGHHAPQLLLAMGHLAATASCQRRREVHCNAPRSLVEVDASLPPSAASSHHMQLATPAPPRLFVQAVPLQRFAHGAVSELLN
jgi:hypothetical protein